MILIEFIWTILPMCTLLILLIPSILLLYTNERLHLMGSLNVVVTGHQWYWRYCLNNFINIRYDSFITPIKELIIGGFRLLEVDNPLILPFDTLINISVTSSDVLHSWRLPIINIKLDGNPIHFNTIELLSHFVGKFYGICSEMCGINHSFIPISVEFTNIIIFINYLKVL